MIKFYFNQICQVRAAMMVKGIKQHAERAFTTLSHHMPSISINFFNVRLDVYISPHTGFSKLVFSFGQAVI